MSRSALLLLALFIAGCSSQNNTTVALDDAGADWPFDRPHWAASAEPVANAAGPQHRTPWVAIEAQVVTVDNDVARKLRRLISFSNSDAIVVNDAGVETLLGGPINSGSGSARVVQTARARVFEGFPASVDVNGDQAQMRLFTRVSDVADNKATVRFEAQSVSGGQTVVAQGMQRVPAGYTIVRPVDELAHGGETCFIMVRAARMRTFD